MKTRLLCLLLALLLCLSVVFVACNDTPDETPDGDAPATNDVGEKKGDIEVEGAAQDATVTVPGQSVGGFSKPE